MIDEKIVAAIKNGDERIFDKVITKYSKLMWRVVGNILPYGATRDVEECVADVFIYLWQHPDQYDSQKGSLKSWLSVIARSRALNKLKEISKHQSVSLDEAILTESFEVDGKILDKETVEMIVAAVKSLNEPDREIFIRKYCYEETVSKIAEDLNLSEKSVEGHLYRTRLRLRKLIEV